MAYLISDASDMRTVHGATYGLMSKLDASFLREKVERAFKYAKTYTSTYLEEAKQLIDTLDLGSLQDKVEAMSDRFGRRWQEDRIVECSSIADLQQAKSIMRRWIMADPRTKTLYNNQQISGFEGVFFNEDGPDVGMDSRDYRRVVHGMEIGPVDEDHFITFLDELDNEDDPDALSIDSKCIILHAWELAHAAYEAGGQDPTSTNKNVL